MTREKIINTLKQIKYSSEISNEMLESIREVTWKLRGKTPNPLYQFYCWKRGINGYSSKPSKKEVNDAIDTAIELLK